MKKIKKVLSILLAATLVTALCSCGGGSSSTGSEKPAETAQAPAGENTQEAEPASPNTPATESAAPEPAAQEAKAEETATPEQPTQAQEIAEKYTVADLPVAGTYTLYAVRNEGYTVSAQEMEMASTMVLSEDGTGTIDLMGEVADITSWTNDNGVFNVTLSDESTAAGNARGGIIELDIYGTGDILLIYAQEGADTSGYTLLTMEQVKEQMDAAQEASRTTLDHLLDSIDPVSGAHLRYQCRLDALDTVQEFDVYAQNGAYYSSMTTKTAGIESTVVTFIKDGKVYNLYPDKKTGNYVTDLPLSVTNDNILLMDNLYSEMRMASVKTDFTEEEREFEGASYQAEVYPQTDYDSETIFYFDQDGALKYCFVAAPVLEEAAYLGEQIFTVETIDAEIDASLFDISAYTIAEQ